MMGPTSAEGQLAALRGWMLTRGWAPLPHQEEAWAARTAGHCGLVLSPTGSGKTYAAYMGALAHRLAHPVGGTSILYVTPLKALSRDIALALTAPLEALELSLTVAHRTGDSTSAERRRMRTHPPDVLVTTPESIALMATYDDAPERFASVQTVIVDEWHALLDSKRGTLLELTLARLRTWAPAMTTWGLSATLGDAPDAAKHLAGTHAAPQIIRAAIDREIVVEAIVPRHVDAHPWKGHLGLHLLAEVLPHIDIRKTTIVFTNTRSQAERWYAAILEQRPEWFEWIGLHHGSIDPDERERVESGMRDGHVRLVVATASLDLGIDVGSIESVIQIGSPRSVARLLQRAGRAGHRPGATCRVLCVPTHGIELVEIDCLRAAVRSAHVEPVAAPREPMDVLIQHLVSCGLGQGFVPDSVYREVRGTHTYRALSRARFDEALAFAASGGRTLQHYDQFQRLEVEDGVYRIVSRRLAALHRMNLGTIDSAASVRVRFANGKTLGTVEESFIARLRPGEPFLYQGASLTLTRLEGDVAIVRKSAQRTDNAPRWAGGLLPFSKPLGDAVRERWTQSRVGDALDAHVEALRGHQAAVSSLPMPHRLLVEYLRERDQHWLFFYPFEGFITNEAFGTLVATRLSRRERATYSVVANEYGVALLTGLETPLFEALSAALFSPDELEADVREACNLTELAKRRFRSIARVSGLVVQHQPGRTRRGRQLQASSSLLFDVFASYDPSNLLLAQAEREVLEMHFDLARLQRAFDRVATHGFEPVTLERPSPLAFPLMIELVRAHVTNETLQDRVERMKQAWTTPS